MKPLSYLNHDLQEADPQYLENLATGYWFSEVLFTAVEMELFTLLDPAGKTVEEIARELGVDCQGIKRFLQALWALGLLAHEGAFFFNTKISQQYLVKGKQDYQGDSILWRKYLCPGWQELKGCLKAGGRVSYPSGGEVEQLVPRVRQYIRAMDNVAGTKVREILSIFADLSLKGELLDVGAGSGAIAAGFLGCFPSMRAVLMDLPQVLDCAGELMRKRGGEERVSYCPANILETWPVPSNHFDLIILSNVVHAYAENEIAYILGRAAQCLHTDGLLLIHDFFPEHYPEKAALFDLNMFINTYNGKVFAEKWVREQLAGEKLYVTELIPLQTDTALMIASKNENALANLCLDQESRLIARIRALGFRQVYPITVDTIHVPDWADLRCQFGCELYERPHCPPHSPSPEKTRQVLQDYSRALLLEGEPPTREFQYRVLQAEKEAFRDGYYKAFAYWAGPCALCDYCAAKGECCNTRDSRPSMEGAGIDVFETVRRAGLRLQTLEERDNLVKYFALILLE